MLIFSKHCNYKVHSTTRRFQSQSDKSVPMFLPDYGSTWHTTFSNIEDSVESRVIGNQKNFKEAINLAFQQSSEKDEKTDTELAVKKNETGRDNDDDEEVEKEDDNDDSIIQLSESSSEIDEEQPSKVTSTLTDWSDLLGLRAFKVINHDDTIANIVVKEPSDPSCLVVADFDPRGAHSQILYKYASNILRKESGRSLEEKEEVKNWLKTIPPRPVDRAKGFNEGDAKKWYDHKFGEDHKLVLQRVLEKSNDSKLKRPDQSEYLKTHTLATDQKTLDSLPEQEFLVSVGNSHNIGCFIISYNTYLLYFLIICY